MNITIINSKKDRWRWAYLLLPLGYPVALIVSPIIHIDNFATIFMVLPFLLLCAAVIAVFATTSLIIGIKHKYWRSCLSTALFPVLMVLLVPATRPLLKTGEILSFYPMYFHFQRKVDAISGDEKDKLVVFTMDGWLSMSNGFAFDGSDEMRLPDGAQSKNWLNRAKNTELQCPWTATHITGHYYYWDSTC